VTSNSAIPPASSDSVADHAQAIHEALIAFYGYPQWREPLPALDELVSTILSQNTNDANRDRAFNSLRQRFPSWEEVRDAEPAEVIKAIHPAGLANQKGPRIQEVLRQITQQHNSLDLSFLHDMSSDDASAWLLKFKGVGPKTVAIVLQFSLNKPAFPVDTHIHRVSTRTGLITLKTSAEQAHILLAKALPKETYYAAHLNMIRLGREICQARLPKCGICPITNHCNYFRFNRTQSQITDKTSFDSRMVSNFIMAGNEEKKG